MALPTRSSFNKQVHPRTLLVSGGLFVCSAGFVQLVQRVPLLVAVFRLEYLVVGVLVLSAVVAVRDDGLWRAWLFTFALAAGFGIHLAGIGITGRLPGPVFRVAWAGFVGAVAALSVGTLGGSLGLGLKRLSLD